MVNGGGAESEKNFTSRHSSSANIAASLTENIEPSDVGLALGRRSGSKTAGGGSTLLIQK